MGRWHREHGTAAWLSANKLVAMFLSASGMRRGGGEAGAIEFKRVTAAGQHPVRFDLLSSLHERGHPPAQFNCVKWFGHVVIRSGPISGLDVLGVMFCGEQNHVGSRRQVVRAYPFA